MGELLEYDGEVVRTTDAGIAIEMGGRDGPVWFPRSQLGEEGDIHGQSDLGDTGKFLIPEWLAIEKGLE
jgi:hypothetical protein